MQSKRMRTWLKLIEIASVIALVGCSVPLPSSPIRPMICFVIVMILFLARLYLVRPELPPIRFQIQTIMIVVAMVAAALAVFIDQTTWPFMAISLPVLIIALASRDSK